MHFFYYFPLFSLDSLDDFLIHKILDEIKNNLIFIKFKQKFINIACFSSYLLKN